MSGDAGFEARVAAALATAAGGGAGVALSYGTAGFRARHDVLDEVCVKMGMLSALRALHTGAVVGVMVTASHNPIEDNGMKMIDPDGGMLAPAWERVRWPRGGRRAVLLARWPLRPLPAGASTVQPRVRARTDPQRRALRAALR